MNERSGDKINISNNLITKGPKEHYLIDEFELDEITKEKTVYSHIIEIIEYFSKFLKSYVVIIKRSKRTYLFITDLNIKIIL